MRWSFLLLVSSTLLIAPLGGCSKQTIEPRLAPSASSPDYAVAYPEALSSVREGYFADEKSVRETLKEMEAYPDAVSEVPRALTHDVYRLSDEQGKSRAYSEHYEKTEIVREFYDAEKEAIGRKVAGAVQYAAKKKQCQGDIGGSAAYALDKAFEERLEESLHARSDAHQLIDDHAKELGPQNVEALETQSDDISAASYLAHVGVVRRKLRLRRMIDEADEVKKTLERTIADLDNRAASSDVDDGKRAELRERRERAQKATARLEIELEGAKRLLTEIEERTKALQTEYDEGLESLLARVAPPG